MRLLHLEGVMGPLSDNFKSMFRQYDIRGRLRDDELCVVNIARIVSAFAVLLNRRGQNSVVLGYDNRKCSPAFYEVACEYFMKAGFKVYAIGLTLSPVLYFATHYYDCPGGMMITASHNPDGWSGFKLTSEKSLTFSPSDIQELLQITESGEKLERTGGTIVESNIRDAYINNIIDRIKVNPENLPRVVIDAANGGAGVFAYELLHKLGCLTFQLNCDLDDNYPRYFPNPSDISGRELLKKTLLHPYVCGDIGFSFDGDGDRIGVLDEKGENVWSDRLMLLLVAPLLKNNPDESFVFDVKCTQALAEYIFAHGGNPIAAKTGHSYIKRKMAETGASLAGERSGHIYWGGAFYYGFDDALFTAAKVIEALSWESKPIGKLLAEFPRYCVSSEITALCDDRAKYAVIERLSEDLKSRYPNNYYSEIDGFKLFFKDGWGLVRASSNMPELVIVFEAKTPEKLKEYYNEFRMILDGYVDVDKNWRNDDLASL